MPFEFADVVNRTDVGMIEGGGRLRFPLETFQSLAILGQGLGQELERDKPVQAGVFSLVDHAHAPATQFLEDAVMRNRSA